MRKWFSMVLVHAATLFLVTLGRQEERSRATQRWQRAGPLLRQGLSQKGYGRLLAQAPLDDGELLLLVLLLVLLLLLDASASLGLLPELELSLELL